MYPKNIINAIGGLGFEFGVLNLEFGGFLDFLQLVAVDS